MILFAQLSNDTPQKLLGFIYGGQTGVSYPGYTELNIPDGTAYKVGDYYNPADKLFYADASFQHLSGWISPDDVYRNVLSTLFYYINNAAESVRGGYSELEINSLLWQEKEALAWSADNTYQPPLLNAISASSGVALPDLVAKVVANSTTWKAASGSIYGQARVKVEALNALRLEAWAGTKTNADIQAYDCSISIPTSVLS